MRNAPSVQYPVGRCVFERRMQFALVLVWLGVQSAWALDWGLAVPPGAWWLSCLCGLAAVGCWRWRSRRGQQGWLCWDAAVAPAGQWHWRSEAYRRGTPLRRLEWVLDLQSVALLRLHTAAGLTLWVWLQRRSEPSHWDALRRALKAHADALRDAPGSAPPAGR